MGNLNYINVPVNLLWRPQNAMLESEEVCVFLHAVALVGRHPSVGVVEGPSRGRSGGATVAQHQLWLSL